jgi:hypothetical protein
MLVDTTAGVLNSTMSDANTPNLPVRFWPTLFLGIVGGILLASQAERLVQPDVTRPSRAQEGKGREEQGHGFT